MVIEAFQPSYRVVGSHLKAAEIDGRVDEDVDGGRARGEEGAPPPVVVLGAELEVAHDHRDLGAGRDEDEEHQQREPEHVVVLLLVVVLQG